MKHLSLILMSLLALGEAQAQSDIKLSLVSGTGRGGDEGPAMICDGRTDTKWCIDMPRQMPYTLVFDAGQETSFAEYGFVTGDDTQAYPDRNPVTWRVSGSNDKTGWTLIDERRNDRSIGDENEQEYRFAPRHKGQYRYYRFEFLRMAGSTRIQLSEINLHKTMQTPIPATFTKTLSNSPLKGEESGKEGPEMACDGRFFTKWCIDEPGQMPYTITLDAGSQTPVTEYRFWTGDDTHTYPSRNPVCWRFSGSNDKQTWTVLDEQKNNRRLRDENEQEFRFMPPVKGQYRYYRFEFIKMTAGTRLQLSEIKLYK